MAPSNNRSSSSTRNGASSGDVLPGPKSPTWCCSCGTEGNWASRVVCRGCRKGAPQSYADRARAAAKKCPSPSAPKPARGQWARGPPGDAERRKQDARIKQLEADIRKLRATKHAEDGGNVADTDKEAKDEAEAISKLRAEIKALEGITDTETCLEDKREKLKALQQEKQASKPLHLQLRDIQARIDRKERNLKHRNEVDLPQLLKTAEQAQQAHATAVQETLELEAEIAELREQKQQAVAAEKSASGRLPSAGPQGEDFATAFGRLATVLEALPRAYHSGNMESAYDGIMENLRGIAAFDPRTADPGAAAGAEVAASEDEDDVFPDNWTAPDSQPDIVADHVRKYPDVSGLGADEADQRIRNYLGDFLRDAKDKYVKRHRSR